MSADAQLVEAHARIDLLGHVVVPVSGQTAEGSPWASYAWPEFLAWLAQRDHEEPGRYHFRGAEYYERRELAEEVRTGRVYRPSEDERWVVVNMSDDRSNVYQTTVAAGRAWVKAGCAGKPAGATLRLLLIDQGPAAPEASAIEPTPAASHEPTFHPVESSSRHKNVIVDDGFEPCRKLPALLFKVDRKATTITFRHGHAEETYCLRRGVLLEALDPTSIPVDARAFIDERVRAMPSPLHRTPPPPPEEPVNTAPVVEPEPAPPADATPARKENPMPLDPTDPQQLQAARVIVAKIKENLGAARILERDKELTDIRNPIERAYRLAAVERDQAKRQVGKLEDALKERDLELIDLAGTLKGEDNKAKYTTVDAKKAGAVTLRKTDEAYLAIKKQIEEAEDELAKAEMKLAEAQADHETLRDAQAQLIEDKRTLTASIAVFGVADTPVAPAATSPAPIVPPTALPAQAAPTTPSAA